ncbi:MAG: hypothetical protein JW708_01300, partial [Vallitaleaceae bacterium]|nr:hypothetical protein [Vallitaleaceae bacterium]
DEKGELVYGSDSEISEHFLDNYEKYASTESVQEINLDQDRIYRVGSTKSDVVNWTYFIAWNTENATQGASNIVFMTIILIVMIAVLLLIFSLTRFIYKPIANLREYVSSVVEEEVPNHGAVATKGKDDFRTISGGIESLVDNNHALERMIQVQKEQLSEFFLTRLISGTLDLNQIAQYFDKLGIHPGAYYAVLTVGLANLMNEEYDEAKQDALRLEVMENIPEEIRKRLIMEPSSNARVITLVVSGKDQKEVDEKVIEAYKGLDIFVQMQYEFPIKVGVSTIHSEWKLFRNAHNEAIEALKNNELLHHDAQSADFTGVMFYSDIETSAEKVSYDRLTEKEVREAVDSGDLEKAFACVDNFLKHLFERNVPHMERQFCMIHFMNEILMVAVDAGLSLDE